MTSSRRVHSLLDEVWHQLIVVFQLQGWDDILEQRVLLLDRELVVALGEVRGEWRGRGQALDVEEVFRMATAGRIAEKSCPVKTTWSTPMRWATSLNSSMSNPENSPLASVNV